jgi:hypothetical protein
MIKRLLQHHRHFWTSERRLSLLLGLLFLSLSLLIQSGAGRYSTRAAMRSSFAGDLILDNLPTFNLDFLIIQGAIILWVMSMVLLALRPRYLLFGLKVVSLFIVIRSISINLTHIGIYPQEAVFSTTDPGYGLYSLFSFQGNYFFSGHTGLPFLMALVFYENWFWRRFFFIVSATFAACVLLSHTHYSIDVFAAPFFAYGIYKIAEHLFPHDYDLLPDSASNPRP